MKTMCNTALMFYNLFYFSEYGEFKEKHNMGFFDLVKTPSMACEITLQVKH